MATPHTADTDPIHHTRQVRARLNELAEYLRTDVAKVSDPKAQALFETAAEVLIGLSKACTDFEEKREPAWR